MLDLDQVVSGAIGGLIVFLLEWCRHELIKQRAFRRANKMLGEWDKEDDGLDPWERHRRRKMVQDVEKLGRDDACCAGWRLASRPEPAEDAEDRARR